MNPKMKKVSKLYANVTYVPSFPRQAFYKTQKGGKDSEKVSDSTPQINLLVQKLSKKTSTQEIIVEPIK